MEEKSQRYDKLLHYLFFVILLIGLSLRFYQYLMGRGLWDDEAHLALNFIKYGYLKLMKPLDGIQAAPIFWLFSVKTFAKIFGYGENALRATTFIISILTYPLFYYLVKDLTKNKIVALVSFLLFSVNVAIIYFSAELKPYGVDVSVYLLLIYLAVGHNRYVVKNRHMLLTIFGCLSILYSSVSVVVLTCIACYLFLNWYKEKKISIPDVKMMVAWAVVFIINFFLFIYNHPSAADQKFLYSFAFCPTNVFSNESIYFWNKTIEETFFTMLLYITKQYYFSYVLLIILIVAVTHLFVARKYHILLLVCLPIIMHLGMSMLKLYPFWFRLILYLVPCLIILICLGTYLIADYLARKLHVVVGVAFTLVCCAFLTQKSIRKFPLWPLEIKPVIHYINKNYPNAHVFITTPSSVYKYYNIMGLAKNGIYKEVPWAPFSITANEFDEYILSENDNYILVYGSNFREWPYRVVIEHLAQQGLIVNTYEAHGYIVSEVRPFKPDSAIKVMDHNDFDKELTFGDEEKTVAIWGSKPAISKPIFISKGMYNVTILSKGTPVDRAYPHNNAFMNEIPLGSFNSTHFWGRYTFPFEIKQDTFVMFRINMDNDAGNDKEDRNTFIKNIFISRRKD